MKLASESNGEPECEICVEPVDIAGFSPGTVIDESCKRWFVQESIFNPKCTNKFEPEEGNAECPICVYPYAVADSCSNCNEAPDQFTFKDWFLSIFGGIFIPVVPGGPEFPIGGRFLTYQITEEEFNSYNVSRVSKCSWESGKFLTHTAVAAAGNPEGYPAGKYQLYANKRLGVFSSTSNPANIVITVGGDVQFFRRIDDGAFEPYGQSGYRQESLVNSVAGVCYPRYTGLPRVTQFGLTSIVLGKLDFEPVP